MTLSIYIAIGVIWRTLASLQKKFLQGLGGEEHKGDGAGTEMTFDLPACLGGKLSLSFWVCGVGERESHLLPLANAIARIVIEDSCRHAWLCSKAFPYIILFYFCNNPTKSVLLSPCLGVSKFSYKEVHFLKVLYLVSSKAGIQR